MLIVNPSLVGFEYGVQRDLEEEIERHTGCTVYRVEPRQFPRVFSRVTTPGTRFGNWSRFVPRESFEIDDEPLWIPLMGPENFPFWFRKHWDHTSSPILVYLFDTLPHQLQTIRRMLAAGRIDICITSFPNAAPWLEADTGRPWCVVPQAVNPARFFPLREGVEPVISFCAYGRRLPAVHEAVKLFSQSIGGHYDYTDSSGPIPASNPCDHYGIYAWHLRQSWFTFSWPVEVTNPERAPSFSPMTCRWFEAAASGTIVVGVPPLDPAFVEFFGPDFVEPFEPSAKAQEMERQLRNLWDRRHEMRARRIDLWKARIHSWSWADRVRKMMELMTKT